MGSRAEAAMAQLLVLAACVAVVEGGFLVPVSPLYQTQAWNPDAVYSSLSAGLSQSYVLAYESQTISNISYCNHWATNAGAVAYTPCSAHYLVAAQNYGAILPPNMCGGQTCPTAGGLLGTVDPAQSCSQLVEPMSGLLLTENSTTLFDQYCPSTPRLVNNAGVSDNSFACRRTGRDAGKGQFFEPAPPVFTINTNWCDPTQTVIPLDTKNRVMFTSGSTNYPFTYFSQKDITASTKDSQAKYKHTCGVNPVCC